MNEFKMEFLWRCVKCKATQWVEMNSYPIHCKCGSHAFERLLTVPQEMMSEFDVPKTHGVAGMRWSLE